MREQLRRLGADTAVYGISTIVGRFLNFILVPFYTHVLPPGEYGDVAYVYSLIAFVTIIYGYGMESAYFKYGSTGEYGDERSNFTVPFLMLVCTSFVFSVLLTCVAPQAAGLAALAQHGETVVNYSAWILFFDTVCVVPFASLRLHRKAKRFALLKLVNIVINVASNLILLLVFHAGVQGIFLSGLIASATTALLLLPDISEWFSPVAPKGLVRALLAFGLPYLPAGLASMMIQVVDRPILRLLTDRPTVGIYQANYRLGIVMMLVVSMFDYAWRPFFLSHAKDPEAKKLFARVLTYFVLGGVLLTLIFSYFMEDIVRLSFFGRTLIHHDYWSGLYVVPPVLLGYLFLGIYNNLIAGIYIEKKTQYLPAITVAGAGVNVGLNFALIPVLGMMGAALATLFAYAAMAAILYVTVQRVYPVEYEWRRLGLLGVAGAVSYGMYWFTHGMGEGILWKLASCAVFVVLLALTGFFRSSEIREIRSMLTLKRS